MEATKEGARPAPVVVQELAGVPDRYVVRHLEDRPSVGAAAAPIPVIDLGLLCRQHTGAGAEEAAKLRSAIETWGIFLVTNHGVETSLMDAMMNASREFFGQPMDEKRRYTDLVDGRNLEEHVELEGYGSKQLTSKDQTSLDWSDRLYLKVEPQEERSLHLWPESFRDVLHEYSMQCSTVKERLLSAMARLLGLDDDHFVARKPSDQGTAHARIIYYPPCPRPDLVLGIKPHSDATLVTVLMADDHDVGGLQVLRDGVWYDVSATMAPHALLINVGDLVEIMSNGIFKSPVHRVVTNARKGRTSVVIFYGPDHDKDIGPADQLISDDNRQARYKRVKVKYYLAGLFKHFSRGARVIDTVRIQDGNV